MSIRTLTLLCLIPLIFSLESQSSESFLELNQGDIQQQVNDILSSNQNYQEATIQLYKIATDAYNAIIESASSDDDSGEQRYNDLQSAFLPLVQAFGVDSYTEYYLDYDYEQFIRDYERYGSYYSFQV